MEMKHKSEIQAWVKTEVNASTKRLSEERLFTGAFIEAKPAWVLPFSLLIGKAREHGDEEQFLWFIRSETQFAYAAEKVAETPRQAAKYFALTWQLEAQRLRDSDEAHVAASEALSEEAESLYELTEQDMLWATG